MAEDYRNIAKLAKNLELGDFNKLRAHLAIEEQLLLEKSIRSSDPDQIIKASLHLQNKQQSSDSSVKSYFLDPWSFSQNLGYKDKATSLSYGILRKMSRVPIINAIIGTRLEQVTSFARPVEDKDQVGFMIRKKKRGGKKEVELS